MSSGTWKTEQVMMTLATLSPIAATERPSGESLPDHERRILKGINAQMQNANLPTAGGWKAVWVGLSRDRANLSYLAQNTDANQIAVVVRGTIASLIDLAEDLEVGHTVEFTATASPAPLLLSKGAMRAFIEITSAVWVAGVSTAPVGTTLLQAVSALLESAPAGATVYVTGHSLGGAITTMVALYLASQRWERTPTFSVYTFAAPTAGLQAFASYFDTVFTTAASPQNVNSSFRYYNAWDMVPTAWQTLASDHERFFPSPGPAQTLEVKAILNAVASAPDQNSYVQTNTTPSIAPTSIALNRDYKECDALFICKTTGSFLSQVGFQHANSTYLRLLGVPVANQPIIRPPVVTSVSPNVGDTGGRTVVNIRGSNFTADSMVDFGVVSAAQVKVVSDTQIVATSPAVAGTVDVRVTTENGTSPVTTSDQFAAPPPIAAPLIATIVPHAGPCEGSLVTVNGTGFTTGQGVTFDGALAKVVSVSTTRIVAVTPPRATPSSVAVAVGIASMANAYTYGPPVVYSVSPNCGANDKPPSVTVRGAGFGTESVDVVFGEVGKRTVKPTSDTQIVVTPPRHISPVDKTVTVMVNNASGISVVAPGASYTFVPS